MRAVIILYFLLLGSSISVALSKQRKVSSASNSIVSESLEVFDASSILHRRAEEDLSSRSQSFMKHFEKGAELWKEYLNRIQDLDVEDIPVDFPFDESLMPESIDSRPTAGWDIDEEDGNWIAVPVTSRAGWRYDKLQDKNPNDVEALLLTGLSNIKLRTYEAREWSEPAFRLMASVDCDNGLFVGHNSVFKLGLERSKHRWSDVVWVLWKTMCPEHYLRYFIGENIANKVSRAIFQEAATARNQFIKDDDDFNHNKITVYKPSDLSWKKTNDDKMQPICDQEAGECDFFSILHSSVAIGKVYLLQNHVNELSGNAYISEIVTQSIVDTKVVWNTMFKVDQVSVPCSD